MALYAIGDSKICKSLAQNIMDVRGVQTTIHNDKRAINGSFNPLIIQNTCKPKSLQKTIGTLKLGKIIKSVK